MKTWISACAILLFCSTAVGLAAATFTITVKVAGGVIDYGHLMGTHGAHGHQIAAQGDTVIWTCDSTCTIVAITFKGTSPCLNPGATCDVNYASTDIFPYSVAVIDSKGSPVVSDPDVIVDNSGSKPGGQQKRGSSLPAPKKK
jgi:hypothetical protein